MSSARLTMLSQHDSSLRAWLQGHPQGHERAALLLMRRFRHVSDSLSGSDRYLVVEVHHVEDAWVTSSGTGHVDFPTQHIRHLMQACEERGLSFGFVHSHPSGHKEFSSEDDANEQALLQGLANRNGLKVSLVALILCDGEWRGRVRHAIQSDVAHPMRHVLVLSDPLQLHHGSGAPGVEDLEVWARQRAAFGEPFQQVLRSLRVGVVGAGGTGSPTLTMLARSGVLELVIIDPDALEKTNLNRVRGSRMSDVSKNKVEIAKSFINSIGLGTRVHVEAAYADTSEDAIDALMGCDVVFGCTDDVLGRDALNALAFRHGVVVIDTGIGGTIAHTPGSIAFYQHGRITTLLPGVAGFHCFHCEEVYSQQELHAAQFLRDHPNASEQDMAEAYITGGRTAAPGVGPFTSALADFALIHLYDLLQGFRARRLSPEIRRGNYNVDFVSMQTSSLVAPNHECVFCHTTNGDLPRGLLADNRLRLGRPALGVINHHE